MGKPNMKYTNKLKIRTTTVLSEVSRNNKAMKLE